MRMFAAVVPPDDVLDELDDFWEVRRETAAFRWTLPDQWHITLAFLADVPDRSFDDLLGRLERAGRRRRPMTARISGGGAFPHVGRAKVLWAGVEMTSDDAEELRRLATGCRAAASKSGIVVDGQRFAPHVTLARMARPVEATRWVRILEGFASRSWAVTQFALIASHLGEGPRKRPRYETIATFPLGGAAVPHP